MISPWLFLSVAILFEIVGTFFLKLSDGFAKWQWGMASIGCYWMSFAAFAPALRDLPIGAAYAIWAGVGIVGGVLLGVFVFAERLSAAQLACISLIAVGAIGLRLTTDG